MLRRRRKHYLSAHHRVMILLHRHPSYVQRRLRLLIESASTIWHGLIAASSHRLRAKVLWHFAETVYNSLACLFIFAAFRGLLFATPTLAMSFITCRAHNIISWETLLNCFALRKLGGHDEMC